MSSPREEVSSSKRNLLDEMEEQEVRMRAEGGGGGDDGSVDPEELFSSSVGDEEEGSSAYDSSTMATSEGDLYEEGDEEADEESGKSTSVDMDYEWTRQSSVARQDRSDEAQLSSTSSPTDFHVSQKSVIGSSSNTRRSSLRRASSDTISSGTEERNVRSKRRITLSVPNEGLNSRFSGVHSTSTPRRSSIVLNRDSSRRRTALHNSREHGSKPSLLRNFKSNFSFRLSGHKSSSTDGSASGTALDSAISSLGRGQSNTNWNDVAAAAAVVAAEATPKTPQHRIQFFVGDSVLGYLNVLNHTNSTDLPEYFTIEPVNRFGFPPGEGTTHQEQRGPYSYVLATVKRVHFDEDTPYYTVLRADCGTEQRCDAAWMEPLTAIDGLEAALRAAKRTGQAADEDADSMEELGVLAAFAVCLGGVVWWPIRVFKSSVVPFYRKSRAIAKQQAAHLLYGDRPFGCRVRITGVNVLVFCSLIFVFVEHVRLAFLPPKADFVVTILSLIVWCILTVELVLEWLVRPSGYLSLIRTDKAYAPSTQLYIDTFHLVGEAIALGLFVPEYTCLSSDCGERGAWTGIDAALTAVHSETRRNATWGRLCLSLTMIRMYGLVRHWRNMWLANAFTDDATKRPIRNFFIPGEVVDGTSGYVRRTLTGQRKIVKTEADNESARFLSTETSEEDRGLRKAATIGTALMVTNSHRALFLLTLIAILVPLLLSMTGTNPVAQNSVDLLFENNIQVPGSDESSCAYLETVVTAWLKASPVSQTSYRLSDEHSHILWAQLLPVRCDFQRPDGVITVCPDGVTTETCDVWGNRPENPDDATPEYYADLLDVRVGGITEINRFSSSGPADMSGIRRRSLASYALAPGRISPNHSLEDPLINAPKVDESSLTTTEPFSVVALFDQNDTVGNTHLSYFILISSFVVLLLWGLAVLRGDADRLVLDPLQRMLKIVVRYAENPLSQTATRSAARKKSSFVASNDSDEDEGNEEEQLGNYETEQLINAISKITDLLRKCWGVAGAGIISSNLARTLEGETVVFNPTVPGKRVYALFGFVAIDGFSNQLRVLDAAVMILINDVAKVVHDEVYRWALGDSGQCNKNLGSAFLMVFRIGDFTEVREKKARATDVVFSAAAARKGRKTPRRRVPSSRNLRRRRSVHTMRGEPDDTLQLASLPGIQAFSDRALLGMLKSFAGVYRDKSLQKWKDDFRLSAGVGAFSGVSLIYGMDAGWAVEGAVGSAFKIDATYLSPHVNMASRMMSASKQYGVHILLSQAVEEILSSPARAMLRHLDTVYVKGSSVEQRVYTFDARFQGVDFFLYERTNEQADLDAELYSPAIWNTDQDIRAMRQHVTEDFEKKYKEGKDQYLRGEWLAAVASLRAADNLMIRNVLEEGYIDYNPDEIDGRIFDRSNKEEELVRIRQELGDGACRCLIAYMERRGCQAPTNWAGVRPLTSK